MRPVPFSHVAAPASPDVVVGRARARAGRLARRPAVLLVAALLALASIVPAATNATGTWTKNLWTSAAYVSQDPYYSACTAAAVMTMLNLVAERDSGGPGFTWTPYRVRHNARDPRDYRDMTSILHWERKYDTLASWARGSDAHGWRNALNRFGWGVWPSTTVSRRVYEDLAYATFDAAVRGAVRAIARTDMPVGILAWGGAHAQVMVGYEVEGENPALSDDFTVTAVHLVDPLRSSRLVNARVPIRSFLAGYRVYRFRPYVMTDSPYDDRYTPGYRKASVRPSAGRSEWYGRYVIVAPVRGFVPLPDPTVPPSEPPTAPPTEAPSASPSQPPTEPPSEPPPTEASTPTTSLPDGTAPSPEPSPGTTSSPDPAAAPGTDAAAPGDGSPAPSPSPTPG